MEIKRQRTGNRASTQGPVQEVSRFWPVGTNGITPDEPKLFTLSLYPDEQAALGLSTPEVQVFWAHTKGLLGVGDPALFNSPYDMPLNPDVTLHADEAEYEAALIAVGEDTVSRKLGGDPVPADFTTLEYTRDSLYFFETGVRRPL